MNPSSQQRVKLTKQEKIVVSKMRDPDEMLYKYTGYLPPIVLYDTSNEKIPNRVFDSLFEKGMLSLLDASAFETWYTLSELGKSINL
jgi:hypothetical protein